MDQSDLIYKQAYDAAREELRVLMEEHEAREKRIVVLRQNLQGLGSLCKSKGIAISPSPEAQQMKEDATLSDNVRSILKKYAPERIPPSLIRKELAELGYDIESHQNPLATIYSVLNRMIEAGDVESSSTGIVVTTASGSHTERVFRWLTLGGRIMNMAKRGAEGRRQMEPRTRKPHKGSPETSLPPRTRKPK